MPEIDEDCEVLAIDVLEKLRLIFYKMHYL